MLSWLVHCVWTSPPCRERLANESEEAYKAFVEQNSPTELKKRLLAVAADMKWVFDQLPALLEKERTGGDAELDIPPPPKRPRVDDDTTSSAPSTSASVASGKAKKAKSKRAAR